MKAVITVTGKDTVGIIAEVSAVCAKHGANIREITQSVLSEYFAMIMIAELDGLRVPFAAFADELSELGKKPEAPAEPPAPPAPSNEEVLLTEIRDLLKNK